jgi:multidrug efflux pump subunit AcrB
MAQRQEAVLKVVETDPDVAAFGASIGGSSSSGLNTGRIYIQLKPLSERVGSAQQFIDRLRPKLRGFRLRPTRYIGNGEPRRMGITGRFQ